MKKDKKVRIIYCQNDKDNHGFVEMGYISADFTTVIGPLNPDINKAQLFLSDTVVNAVVDKFSEMKYTVKVLEFANN